MSNPVVILGAGYTGRSLAATLNKNGRTYFATSRDPSKHLEHLPIERRICFDLLRSSTWSHVPVNADLLWCFPAAPPAAVRQFAETADLSSRRFVVLGSTSAYDVEEPQEYPPPWIDETASIDLSKPRVEGEEYLRKDCGAVLLRVAGIYGPDRNPLEWIKRGRVVPSRKYVNLIHVEDLAIACLAALERGKPGEVYSVSDGTPRTWQEIYETMTKRADPPIVATEEAGSGKRIEIGKLVRELRPQFTHTDLFEALSELNR